jgi:DNA-binding CsgD family transcriptional regulator
VPVEEVRRLRGEGKGPAEIAEALGVSRMSVWRALNAGAA